MRVLILAGLLFTINVYAACMRCNDDTVCCRNSCARACIEGGGHPLQFKAFNLTTTKLSCHNMEFYLFIESQGKTIKASLSEAGSDMRAAKVLIGTEIAHKDYGYINQKIYQASQPESFELVITTEASTRANPSSTICRFRDCRPTPSRSRSGTTISAELSIEGDFKHFKCQEL